MQFGQAQQNTAIGRRLAQADLIKAYSNQWQIELMEAPCKAPGCGSPRPPSEFTFPIPGLRLLISSQYVCCGGHAPCAGKCGEQNSPEACLCLEVRRPSRGPCYGTRTWPAGTALERTCVHCGLRSWQVSCCFPSSVLATRFLIQHQMLVMNTKCDDCLIVSNDPRLPPPARGRRPLC
eukprot:scaffold1418_cov352-Prasinococcus_capsulatus_cf.AAC.5